MLSLKLKPFSFLHHLLPLSLLFASTFFSFSHGVSPFSEIFDERKFLGDMQEWGSKRDLAETSNETLILAANRTRREDIFNGSAYYTGGWNFTDKHYLTSLAVSGRPPFVVALVWFVGFPIFLIIVCICQCCCRKKENSYSPKAYGFSLALLCLCTIAAIIGTTVLFIGQDRLNKSMVGIMHYFLKEAKNIEVQLKDLHECLISAKKVGVEPGIIPKELLDGVDSIGNQIDAINTQLSQLTTKGSDEVHRLMHPIDVALFNIAITCLVLALLGSLCSVLGYQCIVFILVILGWLLVVGTLVMSCIFLVIHNGMADTCQALSEWLQNPNANSAMRELLPKVDAKATENIVTVSKTLVYGIVVSIDKVSLKIANTDFPKDISSENLPPDARNLYYNQSGPLVPLLCNPYNQNMSDRKCSKDEVDYSNAGEVWKKYVCEVSTKKICKTQGRILPDNYTQLVATAKVSYGLHKYSPVVVNLLDLTFIKQVFANVKEHNCPSLTKYSEWTYSGFLTSSFALMKSMIIWVIFLTQKHYRDKHKRSNH